MATRKATMIHGNVKLPSRLKTICHVSNGQQIVATDATGKYRIKFIPGLHRFLFVIPPDGYRPAGRFWWACDPETRMPEGSDFALQAAPAFRRKTLTALHVSDLHFMPIRAQGDTERCYKTSREQDNCNNDLLFGDLTQLIKRVPRASLIVATGDLTDMGQEHALEALTNTLGKLPVPVYCVFGGHDGNTERFANGLKQFNMEMWTRYVGPPWYSFHAAGRHFLAGLSEYDKYLDPNAEKLYHDFVAADLRLFGKQMPVTFCAHKNPYPWNSGVLRRYRVDSAIYGHFHSDKASHDGKILTFATGSLTMGSFDLSAGHARQVEYRGEGQPTAKPIVVRLRRSAGGKSGVPSHRSIVWSCSVKNVHCAAAPCLSDGRLYVGLTDESSASQGGVLALNARNGSRLWQTTLGPSVTSPVTVHDNMVLVNTIDGKVACLDAATGRLRWQQQMPDRYNRWIYGRPVVAAGRVYAGSSSYMSCFDLKTGKPIWSFDGPEQTSDAMGRLHDPYYYEGNIFVTGVNTPTYLLDAGTGKVINREPGPRRLRLSGRLAVVRDQAFIGDMLGAIHCFDLNSGRYLWGKKVSDSWITAAAVDFCGSFLLGTAVGLGRYSYKNARRLAGFTPGDDLAAVVPNRRHCTSCMGVAATCGRNVWVGASDGFLYHLHTASLRVVNRVNFHQPLVGHLAHDQQESLYAITFDGELCCLRAKPMAT